MATKRKNEFGESLFDVSAYYARRTNDYEKFRFAEGNRSVESIAKVKRSIQDNGYYRQPILVNERFEIIEGQHRFQACKDLKLPVEYVVQDGLTAMDCAPLNTGRKNWNIKDYVHLGSVEKDDYRYFEFMLQHFGFSPAVTYVATGRSITGGGISGMISRGTLTCSPQEYETGCKVLEWLRPFRQDVKDNDLRGYKDPLYAALIFAYNSKQVMTDDLTDRVHRNFSRYGRAVADMMDAIDKTEKIYNYKCRNENKADLVSEYRQAIRKEQSK